MLVIGHRGAEALAPENTWAALKAGTEAGADIIELDVQLSRDGEAVVFHDYTLFPKLGDPRWVRDLDWDELRGLDIGSRYGSEFTGERMPRFAEVLDWARGRVPLQVDLKHGLPDLDGDRLETTTLALIDEAGMAEQVLISSWDEVALARVHSRRPEILLGINLRPRVVDPVRHVRATGARWVTLFWPQVDRQTVVELQGAGLIVALANLFTGDYTEALRLGVDAVSAEDPATVRAALAIG